MKRSNDVAGLGQSPESQKARLDAAAASLGPMGSALNAIRPQTSPTTTAQAPVTAAAGIGGVASASAQPPLQTTTAAALPANVLAALSQMPGISLQGQGHTAATAPAAAAQAAPLLQTPASQLVGTSGVIPSAVGASGVQLQSPQQQLQLLLALQQAQAFQLQQAQQIQQAQQTAALLSALQGGGGLQGLLAGAGAGVLGGGAAAPAGAAGVLAGALGGVQMQTGGLNADVALAIQKAQLLAQGGSAGGSATSLPGPPSDPVSKHARKVYVGAIPPHTTDLLLRNFFNQTLRQLLPNAQEGDFVVSTFVAGERKYAFVEFRSIEEANFVLNLDGLNFLGNVIKMRRPQDYNGELGGAQFKQEWDKKGGRDGSALRGSQFEALIDNYPWMTPAGATSGMALSMISSNVEDGPEKIFIGGLPHSLEEKDIVALLQAIAPLKAFHLVKDRDGGGTSKGFAFCQFREPKFTEVAVEKLNGLELGDRKLTVRRAMRHTEHKAAAAAGGSLTPGGMGQVGGLSAGSSSSSISLVQSLMAGGGAGAAGSSLLDSGGSGRDGGGSSIGRISTVVRVLGIAKVEALCDPTEESQAKQRGLGFVNALLHAAGHPARALSAEVKKVVDGSQLGPEAALLFTFGSTQDAVKAVAILRNKSYEGKALRVAFAESPQGASTTESAVPAQGETSSSSAPSSRPAGDAGETEDKEKEKEAPSASVNGDATASPSAPPEAKAEATLSAAGSGTETVSASSSATTVTTAEPPPASLQEEDKPQGEAAQGKEGGVVLEGGEGGVTSKGGNEREPGE
uniref:RRM domain-containing protein n=1 Tax=Chromera velia CCMP2878 TaxID=1169474 RepID=A0A0G4GS89_9ALVE|eukprot:Cvel_23160.t1-p1 / transcript=Cvel_23160.t1 / gene=Cvel_23160 / organism=Chromera_velia_CCMP2878 / gene_product=Splicing factor U2af large subunit B, putative / transcript_product=Splicing factor U2af large subunit B, putative / location=Cvel_scaffold2356:13376-23614(-) / protein_length=796 / sequence_SO=supercontig / SO=protein_coding / is_pseudo=false